MVQTVYKVMSEFKQTIETNKTKSNKTNQTDVKQWWIWMHEILDSIGPMQGLQVVCPRVKERAPSLPTPNYSPGSMGSPSSNT